MCYNWCSFIYINVLMCLTGGGSAAAENRTNQRSTARQTQRGRIRIPQIMLHLVGSNRYSSSLARISIVHAFL
jgi:hypothetical protein